MTVRPIAGEDAGDSQDWHPGELRRALERVEDALAKLTDKVVVQAVYEVEQREQNNEIRQLALRLAEDRIEYRELFRNETAERERWQAGMVSRMWWLAGVVASAAVGLLAIAVSLIQK